MTELALDRDEMREILKKPRDRAAEILEQTNGFSMSADFGKATNKISVIVRLAIESAAKAAVTTQALCAIAGEAVDDLAETEASILEALDNFQEEELG